MRGDRLLPVLAALSAVLAIGAGAFGAHGAEARAADWLRTGASYQMIHALAALNAFERPRGRIAAWLFVGGAGVFAGTLYLLALGSPRWLGAITPLGGLAMIAGWLVLALGFLRRR